jgi:CPA1 family monovalent cation:H+ antiporter
LLFLFFGLTIAVIIKQLQKTWSFIPYTPTLFMVSVALGYYSHHLGAIGDSIAVISKMDPRGILIIFLPPLIFEGAFNSDWYIFRKQSVQIFILAFPSVVISALVIMFSLKIVIGYD